MVDGFDVAGKVPESIWSETEKKERAIHALKVLKRNAMDGLLRYGTAINDFRKVYPEISEFEVVQMMDARHG